jgi:leucyl aminopeptidase
MSEACQLHDIMKENLQKEAYSMKISIRSSRSNDSVAVFMQHEHGHLSGKPEQNFEALRRAYEETESFEKEAGAIFENAWLDNGALKTGVVVQAGDCSLKSVMKMAKSITRIVKKVNATVDLILDDISAVEDKVYFLRDLGTALSESAYKFDTYKTEKKDPKVPHVLNVILPEVSALRKPLEEGIRLGETVNLARTLVNEPANTMLPEQMAAEAERAGKQYGFDVQVFDDAEIEKLYMPAYLTVAQASENRPKLIVMTYKGDSKRPDEILGLVGKGLSFDTGGYSLKSKDGMIDMKTDMGGAAAVIGAISAIAVQGLEVNVTAVVAACENMISGGGYRPGDIIQSRGNKTIFIKSTDAEGRLTLIDAVDYIIHDLKVTKVVDIATLTGAQVVALGSSVTGAVSNNDGLWSTMLEASAQSGEKMWRMPLFEEIVETIKHKEADLTNAVREAGMITAGAFIGEFVGQTPWIHLDIAGPSYTKKPAGLTEYGATGVGVKSLYYLAKAMEA